MGSHIPAEFISWWVGELASFIINKNLLIKPNIKEPRADIKADVVLCNVWIKKTLRNQTFFDVSVFPEERNSFQIRERHVFIRTL
jgi:hypothetical protein